MDPQVVVAVGGQPWEDAVYVVYLGHAGVNQVRLCGRVDT